jgi:dihydrofolate reductase
MFTLIVAADNKGQIGFANQLPWCLPKDMAFFKTYTQGKTVLLGSRTALSIGRALPNRTNLVLTSKPEAPYPKQIPMHSLRDVLAYHRENDMREIVVCGGELVYTQLLPWCTKLLITRVNTILEQADAKIPPHLLNPAAPAWIHAATVEHSADVDHAYSFKIDTYALNLAPWEKVPTGDGTWDDIDTDSK